MTRGILIVGNKAPLTHAFAGEAAKRVDLLAASYAPDPFSESTEEGNTAAPAEEGSAIVSLPWNPSSAISARTLVRAALNRLGHIDDTVLLCTPYALRKRADEMTPSEIEVLVSDQIMSWFYLVRELSACLKDQKKGTLSLVLSEAVSAGLKDDPSDLSGPSIAASFRALAQGLLAASFNETYNVLGFSSSEIGDEEGFASYAFRIMDDCNKRTAGKWYKYGKLGLFKR